jgi:hypothetical protein
MTQAIRWVALAIGLFSIAAIVVGWMPGLDLGSSTHQMTATIGLSLTIPLSLGAIVALVIAWRGRPETAAMWSVATLTVAGLFLVVKGVFVGFAEPQGVVLWPRVAFMHAMRAIGALHMFLLALPVGAAVARRRDARERAALPRAIASGR